MFDRLFRRAERKIDSVVSKYVRRALAAVPLLIAAIFATLAASSKLVEMYGPVNGYALMAGGFVVLSGVIALFALTGRSTPVEEAEAAAAEDPEAVKEEDDKPLVSADLLSLIATAAPLALPAVARLSARRLPLIVALGIIVYLFVRYSGRTPPEADDAAPDQAGADTPPDDATTEAARTAAAAQTRAEEATASMAARTAAAAA